MIVDLYFNEDFGFVFRKCGSCFVIYLSIFGNFFANFTFVFKLHTLIWRMYLFWTFQKNVR